MEWGFPHTVDPGLLTPAPRKVSEVPVPPLCGGLSEWSHSGGGTGRRERKKTQAPHQLTQAASTSALQTGFLTLP